MQTVSFREYTTIVDNNDGGFYIASELVPRSKYWVLQTCCAWIWNDDQTGGTIDTAGNGLFLMYPDWNQDAVQVRARTFPPFAGSARGIPLPLDDTSWPKKGPENDAASGFLSFGWRFVYSPRKRIVAPPRSFIRLYVHGIIGSVGEIVFTAGFLRLSFIETDSAA